MSDDKCPLCGDYNRIIKTSGIVKYMGEELLNESFLYESKCFFLIPGPGSIVKGYYVLIPNKHYTKFADMDYDMLDEVQDVFNSISSKLNTTDKWHYIMFEHGSGEKTNGAASISHAHMHIIPAKSIQDIRRIMKRKYEETILPDINALNSVCSSDPYVFLSDGQNFYYYNTPVIESQYLRKLIAAQWGVADKWNWKQYVMKDNYLLSIEEYRKNFK